MSEVRREDRRTRRTTAAIKRAFWEIANEKGFERVTVSEIAERADINRKTFYHHYESLEVLEDQLLNEGIEEMSDSIREGLAAQGAQGGNLDVNNLFQVLSVGLLEAANKNGMSFAHVDIKRRVQHMEPLLNRILKEEFPESFEGVPEKYLRYIETFFCSGILASFQRWAEDDSEVSMEELGTLLSACVAGGASYLRQQAATSAKASDGASYLRQQAAI